MSVLVTGATGTIGSHVVRLLASQKTPNLRAMVRDTSKSPAITGFASEVVIGDFDDVPTLQEAMLGVETLVLITPPASSAEQQAANAIDAALAADVRRVVRVSAINADKEGPTNNTRAHGHTDDMIATSGLKHVILRPSLFMQNMLMIADTLKATGAFSFATAQGKIGMIDARDIAACVAECTLSKAWDGQTLDLTGPDSISYADVAVVLTQLAGRQVDYAPISPDAMYEMIDGAGWGTWMAALARDYGRAYASGWGDFTTDAVEQITGRAPTSFDTFAREVLLPAMT